MDEVKYDILHQIHPSLRKFITYIWTNGQTGVRASTIQILKISSSSKNDYCSDTNYANKFTLSVPYAGHCLEWEVKFSNDDLSFAPDFDLSNDEFLEDLDAKTVAEYIPSWANWDSNEPSSLSKVLIELLVLYKKHQITLLEDTKYSRLNFEYTSLIGETQVDKDDVEVLIEPSGVVHFLISLSIDFSCLPPYIYKSENEGIAGPPAAVLMMTFPRTDGGNTQPQLCVSPHLEQALGGIGNKHIPPFPTNGCLINYVPTIRKLLEDKIKFISDTYQLKQKYIAQLLAKFPYNVLEYNTATFSKATLLFETDNFYWLIVITISTNFPREKPKWMLRSIYHMFPNGEPIMEILEDYPYSPRWCAEEMIDRAMKYTVEKIPAFRNKVKK